MLLKTKDSLHNPLPDGRTNPSLTVGRLYVVVNVETDAYRVVNDKGEPIIYPIELFDVVDDWVPAEWIRSHSADLSWFYFGPLELALPGFFERWHDGEKEARRIFANVYLPMWKHYARQMRRKQPVLKRR